MNSFGFAPGFSFASIPAIVPVFQTSRGSAPVPLGFIVSGSSLPGFLNAAQGAVPVVTQEALGFSLR